MKTDSIDSVGGSTIHTLSIVTGVDSTNDLTTDLLIACDFTDRGGNSARDWTTNRYDFVPIWELPSPTEKPDHGGHQGYSYDHDTGKHIVFDTAQLTRHDDDASWTVNATNASPFSSLTGSPNHIGDGQYYNSLIYTPILQYASCASFGSQRIVTYDATTLAFVAEYDISDQDVAISGLGIDEANGIIYVCNFCDGSFVDKYSLSNPAEYLGRLTLTTPTFSSGPQACYYRGDDGYLYIGHSSKLINVYDTTGDLVRIYQHSEPGDPQGIDYSQTNSLRQSVDNGAADRRVHYFDMSAEPVDQVFTGYSAYVNKIRDKMLASHFQIPEAGTIVTRVKFTTAYNYNVLWDQVNNGDDMECWVDSGSVLRARANNVTLSFGTVAVNTWYDVAYTWNDNGANTLSEVFLNGTSINSDATAPVTSFGAYFFLGGGHTGNPTGDTHYQYFFLFDVVLSQANIATVHADPYALFTTS